MTDSPTYTDVTDEYDHITEKPFDGPPISGPEDLVSAWDSLPADLDMNDAEGEYDEDGDWYPADPVFDHFAHAREVAERNEEHLARFKARGGVGLSLADLKAREPQKWLVEPYMLQGSVVELVGAPGTYKTFKALDWAMRMARSNRDTLYVIGEGLGGLAKRVQAWETKNGELVKAHASRIHFLDQAVDLLDPKDVDGLCDWLPRAGTFRLIIIDTLARNMSGDENDNEVMKAAVAAVDRIRRAACPDSTVLLVHHMGWSAVRQRGSSVLQGAVDTVLHLTPVEGAPGRVKLEVDKQKDQEPAKPVYLEFQQVADSGVLVRADVQRPEEGLLADVLKHLETVPEGAGPKEIAEALGADYDAVRSALRRAGALVRKSGRGIYVLKAEDPTSDVTGRVGEAEATQ